MILRVLFHQSVHYIHIEWMPRLQDEGTGINGSEHGIHSLDEDMLCLVFNVYGNPWVLLITYTKWTQMLEYKRNKIKVTPPTFHACLRVHATMA